MGGGRGNLAVAYLVNLMNALAPFACLKCFARIESDLQLHSDVGALARCCARALANLIVTWESLRKMLCEHVRESSCDAGRIAGYSCARACSGVKL